MINRRRLVPRNNFELHTLLAIVYNNILIYSLANTLVFCYQILYTDGCLKTNLFSKTAKIRVSTIIIYFHAHK